MIEPNFENNLYNNDSVQFSGRGEILISVFFFIKEGAFFHGLKKFSSSLIISGEFSDEFPQRAQRIVLAGFYFQRKILCLFVTVVFETRKSISILELASSRLEFV